MVARRESNIASWTDSDAEERILGEISLDVPWRAIEKLGTLVRTSGSPEEREGFEHIMRELDDAGIPYTLHEPVCFISMPLGASLRVDEPDGKSYRAKSAVMAVSTDGVEFSGDLVYVPSSGERGGDLFGGSVNIDPAIVAAKIVISEGMPSPDKVLDAMKAGAIGGIFVHAGYYIHESLTTSIWGTPDLDSYERQPTIPVISVSNADGQELIDVARRGGRVAMSTTLEMDWRPIPVLVAEVRGSEAPEEFVLLNGHLDGWHYGVADNATGCATILEIARAFQKHAGSIKRSLRAAWWSGHSHGRYAGSTWYADTFAIDMARNCVAQVNCDSPGARWAETYNHLTCMSEAEPFVDKVIREVTGITPETSRPPRAGDYAFNSIGVSSFYMLSSTMTAEKREEMGYYPVGGCGGNIQWHSEDDNMDIADRDNLLRDIKMYSASVLRVLNAPLHPFDWRVTTADFRRHLQSYQEATGSLFDFGPSFAALSALDAALETFYAHAPSVNSAGDPAAKRFNFAQRRLGRLLVRVNYSRMSEFWHDPAINVPPLPDLAPALIAPRIGDDIHQSGILRTHLQRGQNRLNWTLEQAREVVDAAAG
ncbi:MAG TPA: M28 family metallopeptidase [Thermomicrobiales bacterium]|nr:M28 family metallopeptidase [Thermomicrobiales bacterium]